MGLGREWKLNYCSMARQGHFGSLCHRAVPTAASRTLSAVFSSCPAEFWHTSCRRLSCPSAAPSAFTRLHQPAQSQLRHLTESSSAGLSPPAVISSQTLFMGYGGKGKFGSPAGRQAGQKGRRAMCMWLQALRREARSTCRVATHPALRQLLHQLHLHSILALCMEGSTELAEWRVPRGAPTQLKGAVYAHLEAD